MKLFTQIFLNFVKEPSQYVEGILQLECLIKREKLMVGQMNMVAFPCDDDGCGRGAVVVWRRVVRSATVDDVPLDARLTGWRSTVDCSGCCYSCCCQLTALSRGGVPGQRGIVTGQSGLVFCWAM
jgi:hypothetical protein